MKEIRNFFVFFLFFTFPLVSFAAPSTIPPTVLGFIGRISTEILNPIIALMFAIAMAIFIWGVLKYIWNPDNEQARESGRKSMMWGIIGMVIMVSVFGIVRFIISSIGADQALLNYV